MNVSRKLFTRIGLPAGLAALCLSACTLRLPAQTSQATPTASPSSSPAPAPQKPDPIVWTADPALLPKLTPSAVKLGDVSMRVPLGYKKKDLPDYSGRLSATVWSANLDSDSMPTGILAFYGKPERNSYGTLYNAIDFEKSILLDTMHDMLKTNWYVGPVTIGTINGISLAHVTFSGAANPKAPMAYGIAYCTRREDGTFYTVMALDDSADDGAQLDLLNTAIATMTISQ